MGDERRRCLTCRRPLKGRRADAVCCSDACRARLRRWRRRIHQYALRYGALVYGNWATDTDARLCPVCFDFIRVEACKDARYCSHACRQRAYLARSRVISRALTINFG